LYLRAPTSFATVELRPSAPTTSRARRVPSDLDPGDVTSHEGIPIVTAARAIRDAHASHLGPALIRQAIDDGERLGKLSHAVAAELRAELLGQ
jgi:hypothetical protein